MKAASTTTILFDDGDYFVANLDDGGVRIGLRDIASINYPADHADFQKIHALGVAQDAEGIEETFDAAYIKNASAPVLYSMR